MKYILDLETDGLLDTVTKIHCIVLRGVENDQVHAFSGDMLSEAIPYLENASVLVGHNLIAYDLPVLEKLMGFTFKKEVIDTHTTDSFFNLFGSDHKPSAHYYNLLRVDAEHFLKYGTLLHGKAFVGGKRVPMKDGAPHELVLPYRKF